LDSELVSFRDVGYSYPSGIRLAERFPALRGQALEGVTFSVKSGSAIALLGGNGSGKSTLLQLCNGLLVPDSGSVWWQGSPMDMSRKGLSRLRSQVSLLFQDPDDQIFSSTLFEDVAFGPLNQGLDKLEVRERVDEALEIVGLSEYADLPPHVLSHGMRKRAALAGVLAMRPRLMLLDEPTAGLDPESEESLVQILSDLVANGTSILLSTHDLDLAKSWAHEAMILTKGRVAAFGPANRILSDMDLLSSCRLNRRFETSILEKGGAR
jgi:cobalt/nickel transport system ATP-binding protein